MGRFVSEDPHWNLDNMIYGDREYKEGEIRQPDISAILQNSARYVYGLNNPVNMIDPSGEVVVVISVNGGVGFGIGIEAQTSIVVDDEMDYAIVNSLSLSTAVGISASVSVSVFPTIDTVEEYVAANSSCSIGMSINGTGGAIQGVLLEDGTEHIGYSVSVGIGTEVSLDVAIELASQVLKENNYK